MRGTQMTNLLMSKDHTVIYELNSERRSLNTMGTMNTYRPHQKALSYAGLSVAHTLATKRNQYQAQKVDARECRCKKNKVTFAASLEYASDQPAQTHKWPTVSMIEESLAMARALRAYTTQDRTQCSGLVMYWVVGCCLPFCAQSRQISRPNN